jgi:hypothetical protein
VLPANAQAGCSVTSLTDPPREVLRCRGGLTIEAEEATRYRLIDGRTGEPPKGAEVSARAILIDLQPGRRRGFQVLTPHLAKELGEALGRVKVTKAAER